MRTDYSFEICFQPRAFGPALFTMQIALLFDAFALKQILFSLLAVKSIYFAFIREKREKREREMLKRGGWTAIQPAKRFLVKEFAR